jgi:short-subunit dehydrogenase
MTKKALEYLGRSLSNEYKNTNIGIHRLYPGLTITDLITNGTKVTPLIAKLFNTIGDLPENVAKNLCPQILNIEGTNHYIEHATQLKYKFLFLTSLIFGTRNKFFDNEGNFIYKS